MKLSTGLISPPVHIHGIAQVLESIEGDTDRAGSVLGVHIYPDLQTSLINTDEEIRWYLKKNSNP